ncbi:MAG TPA: FAD-binding oxidoreductase [Thermoanaerobaculia bacterium]|nr:FAD-binding oxidoreductase [Thermoanaerobaculia bacterium]
MSRSPSLTGWGLLGVPGREVRSEDLAELTRDAVLTRGLGRSYGDASLPPPDRDWVAGSALADRILGFDPETGVLRAEAGLSLQALNRLFLPRGFYGPVTPGTQVITLGGMVAADVHGKNHHVAGTVGRHVRSLVLRVADGRIVRCSREEEPDLFRATIGGMGLTGHVLEVELQLERVPSQWLRMETERIPDLERFVAALRDSARAWPHTMGWIDCLKRGRGMGRGVLYRGRWAEPGAAPPGLPEPPRRPSMPFLLPSWVVNPLSVGAFNALYYRVPRGASATSGPEPFFYPLDAIGHWNRMYGRRGFTQYQCVVPDPSAAGRFLELLTARGGASMLCVIKDCGEEGEGILSFPRPGISIALDIAVRDDTQSLVDALNETVIAEGGRVYLAKDRFTRAEHFRLMEPRLPAFERVRARWDPERRIRSALSVRLLGDPVPRRGDPEPGSTAPARVVAETREPAGESR